MLKKILIAALFALCIAPARADIATVAGVNEYIAQSWDITMPVTSSRGVLDMSYLMTMIDKANEILNSSKTSDYSHDPEYATAKIVATNAATNAVDTLISRKLYDPQFWFEPASDGDTYEFYISAKGNYTIYWGDGEIETIYRDNTTGTAYSHTYEDGKPASEHKIGLGGESYAYSTDSGIPVISFNAEARRIKSFDGCLGCIFPTLDENGTNGKQPRFYSTFASNTDLTGEIPTDLFNGIRGAPASNMFRSTFGSCSGLTGNIPDNLFGELSGAPAEYMFSSTFSGCTGLTGKIPDNLFGDISGKAAQYMFYYTFQNCTGLTGLGDNMFGAPTSYAQYMFAGTFYGCTGLTGKIPDNLFGTPTGATVRNIFDKTFYNCTNLEGPIPEKLFGTITSGAAQEMFYQTFANCSSLTGKIPDRLFAGVSGVMYENAFRETFYKCSSLTGIGEKLFGEQTLKTSGRYLFNGIFSGCTNLSGPIPDGLFANVTGAVTYRTYQNTFNGCENLTGEIPSDLFAGISGNASECAFEGTFKNCKGLTGKIPDNLFAGITGNDAAWTFRYTFQNATGLTGIGDNLFGNSPLAVKQGIFAYTFSGCTGLKGKIPDRLFANVYGQSSSNMFYSTFYGCSGLTEIGADMFGDITLKDTVADNFGNIFANCTSLTGPSATVGTGENKEYLYQRFPKASNGGYNGYTNDSGLSDWDCIPTNWGGPGTKEPGTCDVASGE